MKLLTKVCGLKHAENIQKLTENEVLPDLYGFIFYARSPRYVTESALHGLSVLSDQTKGKRVGVFVDAGLLDIIAIHDRFPLDYVQLHGSESPELCQQLKARSFKTIKAFKVSDQEDFNQMRPYETACDYFLFDAAGKSPGGNGIRFNWEILQKYRGITPFLLSGGIRPKHVNQILKLHHPSFRGIDLNSGFEVAPGQKDPVLLNHFLKAIA
jgi:phosphoribosylanthranilate isomerase